MNNIDFNSPFSKLNIECIPLERIQIRFENKLPENFFSSLSLKVLERFGDGLAICLEATLFGEYLGEVLLEYPETWWDGFKEVYFPKWLRKKYPVKTKKHHFKQKVMYPRLNISEPRLQDEQQVFILERLNK